MNWTPLETLEQLQEIKKKEGYSVIFKHSTRCSISMMAKKNFELQWDSLPEGSDVYFLDLIKYREVSNAVADLFKVHHESPQVLVIKDGESVYDTSHGDISAELVAEVMSAD